MNPIKLIITIVFIGLAGCSSNNTEESSYPKMSDRTFEIFNKTYLKDIELKNITSIEDNSPPFDHYIFALKNHDRTLLNIAPYPYRKEFPVFGVPKGTELSCGQTKDGSCNCYFWKTKENKHSAECMIHSENTADGHSYIRASFFNLDASEKEQALEIIKSLPNEKYDDANIEASVHYWGFNISSEQAINQKKAWYEGCWYHIKSKNFYKALKKNTDGLSYNKDYSRGKVEFPGPQSSRDIFWIGANMTVYHETENTTWILDKDLFEKHLEEVVNKGKENPSCKMIK